MLVGKLVTLRALTDADMPRLTGFRNDVELELIGGGDPPRPCTLEMVQEFFAERAKDPRPELRHRGRRQVHRRLRACSTRPA